MQSWLSNSRLFIIHQWEMITTNNEAETRLCFLIIFYTWEEEGVGMSTSLWNCGGRQCSLYWQPKNTSTVLAYDCSVCKKLLYLYIMRWALQPKNIDRNGEILLFRAKRIFYNYILSNLETTFPMYHVYSKYSTYIPFLQHDQRYMCTHTS